MSTYVVLLDLTDAGRQDLNATVANTEVELRERVEALGGTLTSLQWTLGSHDAVVVVDLEDALAPGVSAWLGQTVGATTTTLRAASSEDMLESLKSWQGPQGSGLGP